MKYFRVIRLHICRVEKFTVLNNEVITWGYKVIPRLDGVITLQPWGYNPGVFRVIDAELSELWGYKVIPRVDGVITP